MANLTSIARPYAKALLELASVSNAYAIWSNILHFLAQVITNEHIETIIQNQAISAQEKAEFLCGLDNDILTEQGQNLIRLLAQNKRLAILPALYETYEHMRKSAEHQIDVQLILAQNTEDQEVQRLNNSLATGFNQQVNLATQLDNSLIAGAKLKIGDRVIESSIKSYLKDLHQQLTQ